MKSMESWWRSEHAGARGCARPGCERAVDDWLGNGTLCASCGLDEMLQETDRFHARDEAAERSLQAH